MGIVSDFAWAVKEDYLDEPFLYNLGLATAGTTAYTAATHDMFAAGMASVFMASSAVVVVVGELRPAIVAGVATAMIAGANQVHDFGVDYKSFFEESEENSITIEVDNAPRMDADSKYFVLMDTPA